MVNDVPFVAFEAEQMRSDKRDKRHTIIEIILIVSLLASNAFWIFREQQYEVVDTEQEIAQTVEADDNGNASAVIGDVDYGD